MIARAGSTTVQMTISLRPSLKTVQYDDISRYQEIVRLTKIVRQIGEIDEGLQTDQTCTAGTAGVDRLTSILSMLCRNILLTQFQD